MALPLFVPAVVEKPRPSPESECPNRDPRPARKSGHGPGIIEIEIDGVTVRIGRGAEAKTIAAVIRALKASS